VEDITVRTRVVVAGIYIVAGKGFVENRECGENYVSIYLGVVVAGGISGRSRIGQWGTVTNGRKVRLH
jgi:hypothetical protein